MEKLKKKLMKFVKDEEGVTSIEYALIAVSIAVVIVVAVTLVGDNLTGTFTKVANALPP